MESVYVFTTAVVVVVAAACTAGVAGDEPHCAPGVVAQQGDVHFVYILELHEAESGACGSISTTEVQNAAAVHWAINKLNGNGNPNRSYIPGIQIGTCTYLVFDSLWPKCQPRLYSPWAGVVSV